MLSIDSLYAPGKRTFDLAVASLALLPLAPLIAAVALTIRFKLGSPVLFRQTRPGLHGKPFEMLKFRSMLAEKDVLGNLLPDEDRLPPFGRFLRSTSLDELPQLLNVIRGDLSLVGPRPLLMEYLPLYSPEQARRHLVRPGITGWAQVNGRNAIDWEQKLALDVWYVENRSFWLDLRIIAKTVVNVLSRADITAKDQATMPPFEGNR